MSKVFFAPFGIVGSLLAGIVGRRLFRGVWSLLDEEQVPDPRQRETDVRKLIPALLLEGAIFRAVRGLFDYGARRAFNALTGAWPGERRPQPR